MTSILLIAAPLLLGDAPELIAFHPAPSLLPYGAVDGQHLLVLEWLEKDHSGELGRLRWSWCDLKGSRVQPLQDAMPRTARGLEMGSEISHFPRNAPHHHVHRWRLYKGHLWITSAFGLELALGSLFSVERVPFPNEIPRDPDVHPMRLRPETDVPLGAADRAQIAARGAHLADGYHDVISAERGVYREEYPFRRPLRSGQPISDGGWMSGLTVLIEREEAAINVRLAAAKRNDQTRLDFDILPRAGQQFKLVLLATDQISIWQYSYGIEPTEAKPEYFEGIWQRQAAVPSPIKERFHAAERDGTIFIVTDSGAVYSIDGAKDQWTIKELWSNKLRPIIAMITRSQDNGAYLFGKDFYFELRKKIDVKRCRDVANTAPTNGAEKLTSAGRLVYHCGRVLHENGELREEAGPVKK